MAKYNTFKYGDGTKYGATTEDLLLWSVIVDWDGDGYYTGENEAHDRMVALNVSRGRDFFIRPNGGGFERYGAGRATITLDNDDGRYDPYNTSSPLYPNVTPGKSVRIAVTDGNTGTNYSLMRGRIADIQPFTEGSTRRVRVEIVDGQQFLRDRTVRIGWREHIEASSVEYWTTGHWVDLILESAGWPEEWPRSYDITDDRNNGTYKSVRLAWFWNQDAMESIRAMENIEVGTFLHDRNGDVRLFSRSFTYDQIVSVDENQVLRDINIPQPWEVLRNRIEIGVSPVVINPISGGVDTVFSIGGDDDEAIEVAAGGSFEIDAEFRSESYRPSVHNIALVTTFKDDKSNGSALTHTVQIGEYGDGGVITLNNTDASTGYIRQLDVTGELIYQPFASVITDEDAASIATFGTRTFALESPWLQDTADAELMAAFLLSELKDPRQFPTIRMEDQPTKQFGLDLYADAIHFTADTLSINRLYRIGKIEHDWRAGRACVTTLKLEPYIAYQADAEIDAEYSSSSCPGDWEYTPSMSNDWSCPSSWLQGLLDDNNGHTAFIDLQSENIVIGDRFALSFYWRYQNTESWATDEDVVAVRVVNTDNEIMVNEILPFEKTSFGAFTQMLIEDDFVPYIGKTIKNVQFAKLFVNGDPTSAINIDDLEIGQRID